MDVVPVAFDALRAHVDPITVIAVLLLGIVSRDLRELIRVETRASERIEQLTRASAARHREIMMEHRSLRVALDRLAELVVESQDTDR